VYRHRAPLAITLALFAITPLYSAFCHYGTSEQRNHWYGSWFGHDMFTPPFKDKDGPIDKAPLECGVRSTKVTCVAFHPKSLVVAQGSGRPQRL